MDYLRIYKEYEEKINAYIYALWLMGWDMQTETPIEGLAYQNKQRSVLTEKLYNLTTAKERVDAINNLYNQKLSDPLKREIEIQYKAIERLKKIPKQEYLEYQMLLSEVNPIYRRAKEEGDFSLFLPYLEKIVAYNRDLIKYLQTDKLQGYDVLLDRYEEGMGIKEYDKFFSLIKDKLIPFVKKVDEKKINFPKTLINGEFDVKKQKEFSKYLLNAVGYNLNKGVLKESIHPFTSGIVSTDTRITTAYKKDLLDSSIFSTIHEAGHGIYEQQINYDYAGTAVGRVHSLGMHESQSRLYENLIGRSKAFWKTHYHILQQIFSPQLDEVDAEAFYLFVNRVEPGFIRTEADELHYSIHVLIRYEIEKQLFNNGYPVKDLPKLWNKLYKEYLNLTVPNDTLGILQDIHWSGGNFGYFPTYALGSAYASQIYESMNSDINIEQAIKNQDIFLISEWLGKNIHQYGSLKTPKQLIKLSTNKEFNPSIYVNYLISKYGKTYDIK